MKATVSGWVIRSKRLKVRSFLTMCDAAGEHRVVIESSAPPPRLGDHVTVSGALQRFCDSDDQEILAESVRVNAPSLTIVDPDHVEAWIQRRDNLQLRARMLAGLQRSLGAAGFGEALVPLLAGAEAALGASRPFAAQLDGKAVWLPVNHISTLINYQTFKAARRYAFGKLFWQQPYNNRFSLSEINSLDLAAAALSSAAMIDLVDSTIAEAEAMIGRNAPAPVRLRFAEAASMIGLGSDKHALPVGAAAAVSSRVGGSRFWVMEAPARASPYYTAVHDAEGDPRAESFELWMDGVPNVVAGSTWAADSSTLNLHADPELVEMQRKAIAAGLPAGTGATIGVDRLAMALGNTHHVRAVLLDARMPASFRDACAAPHLIAPTAFTRLKREDVTLADSQGETFRSITSALVALGFLEVQPSVLTFPGGVGQVAWYGRAIGLARDAKTSLTDHVAAGLDRVMARSAGFENGVVRRRIEAVAIAENAARQADLQSAIADSLPRQPLEAHWIRRAGLPSLIHLQATTDAGAAPDGAETTMAWRCGVCGYVCAARPDFCPVCMAPGSAFTARPQRSVA